MTLDEHASRTSDAMTRRRPGPPPDAAAIRGRESPAGSARAVRRPHRAAEPAGQRRGHARRRAGARRGRPRRRRADRGEWRGPLHGLPITIKDAIEVGGVRSTGGAVELTDHVPAADAPAVARLKAAGAIVFGKTNVPRWSGDLQTYNEIFGTTNNPWDARPRTRRVVGRPGRRGRRRASPSFEVGTDIGGSVRIPSHCCGVFGLKPSFGVISQRGYLDHVGGGTTDADINVFGPIARSADDLELLLGVLAGPDADRALAWRLELPAPRADALSRLPGRRVVRGTRACRSTASSSRSCAAAADALADAGAKVEDAHPPVDFAEQRRPVQPADRGRDLAEHATARSPRPLSGSHLALAASDKHARPAARGLGRVVRGLRRAAVPGAAGARRSRTTRTATS